MKSKYRVVTSITSSGVEIYNVQRKVWWLPLWYEITWFWDEGSAINRMELEKKKDAYKGRVVRLG